MNNLGVTRFNVGNANAIQIIVDNKAQIMVDFGFSHQTHNKSEIQSFMSAIDDIKLIMLTHWDLDHIKGISQFEPPDYQKQWIVPEPIIDKGTLAALRLICYLVTEIQTDKLIIVSQTNNKKIIAETSYFTLGKGSGSGVQNGYTFEGKVWDTRFNALNNLGLLLAIHTSDLTKVLLLPGDCEYSAMPDKMKQPYTHLVATHHGAEINGLALPACTVSPSYCLFCAKVASRFPHMIHVNLLKGNGYTVLPSASLSLILN